MMKTVNELTGMNREEVKDVVKGLAQMLADLHIYYANLRGYHWHVKGAQFFELHEQFEKLYDAVGDKIDEIAERLLQLGERPENRISELVKLSKMKETTDMVNGDSIIREITEAYRYFIAEERKLIELSDAVGDYVTSDLMHGYLAEQEKMCWMLTAQQSR